ncbi:MAG: cupredoxin domain-containing protein [Chloroflexota bacterium]
MKLLSALMAVGIVAIVVVALGVAARKSEGDQTPRSAEIVMEESRFSPNQFNAKVGVPIIVRITNRGSERHDLLFPSLHMPGLQGVEAILDPGESRTVTLRFEEAGTHTFICSIPGHAAAGMTGAVFVRP